jgi:hypothetical protein
MSEGSADLDYASSTIGIISLWCATNSALPIDKILSVKNARARVSMVSYLK